MTDRPGSPVWCSRRGTASIRGGAIDGGQWSLTALAFVLDPRAERHQPLNGSLTFFRLIGITGEHLKDMNVISTDAVLGGLAATNPLLVSRPAGS